MWFVEKFFKFSVIQRGLFKPKKYFRAYMSGEMFGWLQPKKMLSLQSLSFIAQDQKIFQDISLTLFPSSIVYLKGKNGSGKTSLLRMLAGIQKPTSGDITYGKESIPINKFDMICFVSQSLIF